MAKISCEEVLAYLSKHDTMVLATCSEGVSWATPVFFVNMEFNLYFFSDSKTRHCRNISLNPRVAAAISQNVFDSWQDIKGVQLEGTAAEVTDGPEKGRVTAAYLRKFPLVHSVIRDAAFGILFKRTLMYRLKTETIYFVDNSRGFAWKEGLNLKDLQGLGRN